MRPGLEAVALRLVFAWLSKRLVRSGRLLCSSSISSSSSPRELDSSSEPSRSSSSESSSDSPLSKSPRQAPLSKSCVSMNSVTRSSSAPTALLTSSMARAVFSISKAGSIPMDGVGRPPLARAASMRFLARGAAAASPTPAARPLAPDSAPPRFFFLFFGSSSPAALLTASRRTETSASPTVSPIPVAICLPDHSLWNRGAYPCLNRAETGANLATPWRRSSPMIGDRRGMAMPAGDRTPRSNCGEAPARAGF